MIKAKQILKYMGQANWTTESSALWTLSTAGSFYGINVSTSLNGKTLITTGFDSTYGVYANDASSAKGTNNATKIYIKNGNGESIYYDDGSDVQMIFGYLQTNIDGEFITLYYINSGTETEIDASDLPSQVTGWANNEDIIFRYCETVSFKDHAPSNIVEQGESIDELTFVADDANAHEHVIKTLTYSATTDTDGQWNFTGTNPQAVNVYLNIDNAPFEAGDVKVYVNGVEITEYVSSLTWTGGTNLLEFNFNDSAGTGDWDLDSDDIMVIEYELDV